MWICKRLPGLFCIALALVSGCAHISVSLKPRQAGPFKGMVAWWTGDDTFRSCVPTTAPIESSNVYFVPGMVGKAFLFGADSLAEVAHVSGLDIENAMSIEGWVYPLKDGFQHILAKWSNTGPWKNACEFSLHLLPDRAVRFAVSDVERQWSPRFHNFDSPKGVIGIGTWNHIAATFDGATGQRQLYVNGSLVASRKDEPFLLAKGKADIGLGTQISAPGVPNLTLSGLLDEITLYRRALTGEEILSIYAAGASGKKMSASQSEAVRDESAPATEETFVEDPRSGSWKKRL